MYLCTYPRNYLWLTFQAGLNGICHELALLLGSTVMDKDVLVALAHGATSQLDEANRVDEEALRRVCTMDERTNVCMHACMYCVMSKFVNGSITRWIDGFL